MPLSPRRRRLRGGGTGPLTSQEDWRDWAELPLGVLCDIFSRLPQAQILRGAGAGLACASWRRAAVDDPLLWQHIDLASDEDDDDDDDEDDGEGKEAPAGWETMARAAVDRSTGQCVSFRGRVDGEFLHYLADRAPALRSLHVTCWIDCREERMEEVFHKLPLLEQVVVSRGWFDKAHLIALLDHCPRLKLLDAGGCKTSYATGKKLVSRCKRRIKDLKLPKPSGCICCLEGLQIIADQEDE
ncbi:hypothetical protein ACQ4PT_037291 [Festuca glaucescens]